MYVHCTPFLAGVWFEPPSAQGLPQLCDEIRHASSQCFQHQLVGAGGRGGGGRGERRWGGERGGERGREGGKGGGKGGEGEGRGKSGYIIKNRTPLPKKKIILPFYKQLMGISLLM